MANAINNGKFHKKARRHRRPFFVDVRLARGPEELYEREAEFPVTIIAKRTAASRRQYLVSFQNHREDGQTILSDTHDPLKQAHEKSWYRFVGQTDALPQGVQPVVDVPSAERAKMIPPLTHDQKERHPHYYWREATPAPPEAFSAAFSAAMCPGLPQWETDCQDERLSWWVWVCYEPTWEDAETANIDPAQQCEFERKHAREEQLRATARKHAHTARTDEERLRRQQTTTSEPAAPPGIRPRFQARYQTYL